MSQASESKLSARVLTKDTLSQFVALTREATKPRSTNGKSTTRRTRQDVSSDWKGAGILAGTAFGLAFAYAILRYVVFKGVSAEHIPLFIFDKAIALTSLFLICASCSFTPLLYRFPRILGRYVGMRRTLGLSGFYCGCVHFAINMVLLDPAYLSKFYLPNGRMTWLAEISMLAGILAALIFAAMATTSVDIIKRSMAPRTWKTLHRVGLIGLGLVGVHLAAMGYESWLNFDKWPHGMPPITLVSISMIALVFVIRLTPHRGSRAVRRKHSKPASCGSDFSLPNNSVSRFRCK